MQLRLNWIDVCYLFPLETKDGAKDDTIDPPVPQKMGHTFVPRYERSLRSDAPPQQSARARYAILNRTDALRASLKKGIVGVKIFSVSNLDRAVAYLDFSIKNKQNTSSGSLSFDTTAFSSFFNLFNDLQKRMKTASKLCLGFLRNSNDAYMY